ncbi:Lrp/AsnC family transcriptional regulator [Dactylosporangium sp. NPDC000244]|uniref:Lrp/AsnC family transcriptional regulator n=1 Tax=Dactylosporangium sp. NPDC000244 TaxID=3154365 RepID=UPI003319B20B
MSTGETNSKVHGLDEVDRRLIHALQINPRARWAAIAPVVGVDSVTAARRWERLSRDGLAWVSGHPGPELRGPSAILEVQTHPGATLEIGQALAADREAFTVDLTAGGREMLVLVTAESLNALTSYIMNRMRGLEGVRSTKTHLLSAPFTDAGQWRLRSLSADEVASIERAVADDRRERLRIDPQLEHELLKILGQDGRATVAAMSRTLEVSQRRVRETMAALTSRGRLVTRLDMAKAHSGWPVHAWYFLRVPATIVERVGSALARLKEIRLGVSTVGPYNLVLSVWMKTLADVQRLEVAIEERLPGVTIADRSVVLRTLKKEGRHLDAQGNATGVFSHLPTLFPHVDPQNE